MAGVDAETGKIVDGFSHVQQSLQKIVTTLQGERVMREWFGNPGIGLLGENLVAPNILLFMNILWMLVDLYEPRFKIVRFVPVETDRLGGLEFIIEGEHRPYAHLDWQQSSLFISIKDGVVTLQAGA